MYSEDKLDSHGNIGEEVSLLAGCMPIAHPLPLSLLCRASPNAAPAHVRIPLSYSEDGKVGGEVGLVPRPLMLGFQEVYDLYVYVRCTWKAVPPKRRKSG